MKKATGTMTVTLPNGRQMDVPRGLSGDRLESFVQAKLQEEQAAATLAEVQRVEEASELERTRVELTQLQSLMAEQAKVIEELRSEKKQLEMATPEASAATLALIHASQQAQTLRNELLKDMGAASEWRARFSEDISDVAQEIRRKNQTIDAEVADRKRRNKVLFDDIRVSQGLERQHPELLEVDDGEH